MPAMPGSNKILMVILEDKDPFALKDLVENVRFFCPGATLALYNSGGIKDLGKDLGLLHFPNPRRLQYAKVTPFFFDVFEWMHREQMDFDCFMNLETDMLFIRKGFEDFLASTMKKADYLAPKFKHATSTRSKWRPIRSLRPELPQWLALLGLDHTNEAFSPGQVFSRNYIQKLLLHPAYPEIKRLLKENRSFTLQEVLFPTLTEVLHVKGRSYPEGMGPVIRYRPYQAVSGVKRALSMPEAFFVHPVRREPDCASRLFIHSLMKKEAGENNSAG
jgi:hypothetical protein